MALCSTAAILIVICFHSLKNILCIKTRFLGAFSLFASWWSLWVACELPFARFVGFHCRRPLPSSQAGQPRKEPPNKHIAAIKGCFGNTSLTFARHPHYSGCKIILDWDGCFCPGLIFASWPVVKFGFAQVLSRYASLGDGTHEACPSSYLGWLWWDAWRASCRHKMLT